MRKPRGFREGHTGSLACPHRDVSCCPVCAAKHEEVIEVYGQHYWMDDAQERAQLLADMKAHEASRDTAA
jgi:hypothetical protein